MRFGAVIGQLQDTFIVAASDDEVFFIDQHVAHERVLFERLEARSSRVRCRRRTAVPAAARAGPGQADLLREWTPTLEKLGFALESFGGSTVLLRAVPVLLKGEEPRRLIEGLLDELGGPGATRPRRSSTARSPSSPATPPSRPTSISSTAR